MALLMWVCAWSTVAQAQQVTTVRSGEDTWLDAANQHQNYGTEAALQVGGPKTARRALLRFQVSEIDSRRNIQAARIQVKLAKPAVKWKDQSVELILVSDQNKGWGADSATWESLNDPKIYDLQTGAPIRTGWDGGPGLAKGATVISSVKLSAASAEGVLTLPLHDVSFLTKCVQEPWHNGGFVLQAPGLETADGGIAFHSFDAAAIADRPVLSVKLEGVGAPVAGIAYELKTAGRVSINIYDSAGHVVRELIAGATRLAGKNKEPWDGRDNADQPLPAGKYTWKLLQTQGLTAEYLLTLGTNPDVPWERWPGNHNPVCNVAIDKSGIYFGAGSVEGPPMIVKETADGKRLWMVENYGAFVGCYALAPMGGKLFIVENNGKIHRLNATTGAREATIVEDQVNGLLFRDLAARDGRLLLSLVEKNLVRWLDPDGKTVAEVQVAQPMGVAIEADGSGLVISEGRILRLPARGGEAKVVVTADKLVVPWRMDIDPTSGDILVAESPSMAYWALRELKLEEPKEPAGSGRQVKRFSAAGVLKRAYGDAGGRPKYGRYQPERGFVGLTDISAAPDGSFYVTDLGHPPRTAHHAADGKLLREWFGGHGYSSWAGADPADPTSVWMILNYGGVMRMKVDYVKKTWRPMEIYLTSDIPGLGFGIALGLYIRHKDGQTLLCSNAFPGIVRVDEENGKLVPVSAMCFPGGGGAPGTPEVMAKLKADNKLTYQWADRNGNGQMDLDEVTYPPGIMTVGGNSYVDDTLTYYMGCSDSAWQWMKLNTGLAYHRPQGFTANGAPIYDNAKQQFVGPMPESLLGYGPTGVWRDDQGNMFAAFNGGKGAGMGFWAGRVGDNKVVKYTPDDKFQWVVGRHSLTGGAGPGEMRYIWQIIGAPHGCVAVSDVENSLVHLWDTDGLWVGRLLENPVLNGLPSWVFQIKCENFGGSIHVEKDGNVLFFASNENNVNVFRIRGWDKFQRQQGALTLNTSAAKTRPAQQDGKPPKAK
jgi:hypothetical protein